MRREKRFYMYPGHGVSVCRRMLQNARSMGEGLVSVEKGYLLGSGATFTMSFEKADEPREFRVLASYGRLKSPSDPAIGDGSIFVALPMKVLWITIGYYYFIEE